MKQRSNRAAAGAAVPLSEAGGAVPATAADELGRIISSLGPKIRELRQQKGLSLQQLAERSDVSAAAIHKLERSGMVPTIATLMKLATALNRPVSYFVDEESVVERPVVFTAADQRRPVYTSKGGLELRSITGAYGRFFMAGAAATVNAGADSGRKAMEHPGEELVYVVSGTLSFEVDGVTHQLGPGDALHFRTDRPHRWCNPGSGPAQAVWMALRPM
ncbi:MAG TPA: cupin domain-containing protein [Candidatus Dormibacteraeota bacterium]|jgi:transcriptional regulator with XRE-family HTH domain|nr:cupin domain-containing protein [Candidatus Dormibacteraeota bacterium]